MASTLSHARPRRLVLQGLAEPAYALAEELAELQKSCRTLRAKIDQAQHLHIAQNAQQELLLEAEELNMDLLWFVMDEYKAASRPAASNEDEADGALETDAIALSAQGMLYHKVLKVSGAAKPLYEASVRIALALTQTTGANYHAKEWYLAAVDGLEAIRKVRLGMPLGIPCGDSLSLWLANCPEPKDMVMGIPNLTHPTPTSIGSTRIRPAGGSSTACANVGKAQAGARCADGRRDEERRQADTGVEPAQAHLRCPPTKG